MDNLGNFRDEVKARLKKLNNPSLAAAFAIRAGLRVLPILASGVDEGREFLWFWKKSDRTQHLLALLQAYNSACFMVINPNASIAVRTFAVGEAVVRAAEAIDANAITAATIITSAAHTFAATQAFATARDAIKHSADAAAYAIHATHTVYTTINTTTDLTDWFKIELKVLTDSLNSVHYLQTDLRHNLPSHLAHLYPVFIVQLKKARNEGFDYWANWLEARWQGKAFDIEHLTQSVVLDESVTAMAPTAFNAYLKSLQHTKASGSLNRVRAIFIGSGEAGKTSLIRILRGEMVREGREPMTAGVEIYRWPLPDSPILADLWDFGGQVMAHATHQFFLRERCLYVLVLQCRPQLNPNEEAKYWLEHIRAFGKDAPVLIVGNKADILRVDLDQNGLREKYRNIFDFYDISCTEAHSNYRSHFVKFYDDFVKQLKQLDTHSLLLPNEHLTVLQQLEQFSSQETFLPQAKFDKICQVQQIPEKGCLDRAWLLDLLDKLGVVIHFPEIPYVKDFVLNPRWLTYGVYTLLYSKQLEYQDGLLREQDVPDILQVQKVMDNLGNVLKYPHDKCRFIIDAMVQFQLCYRTDQNTLIIPAKLPSSRPNLNFDKHGALAFDFDCEGLLPRHLIANFIVQHHADIDHTVWQNGVQLRSKSFEANALVEADEHNRRLSLWIKGNQADWYFATLYNTVKQMLGKMPKLLVQEWIRLPGAEIDPIDPRQRASFQQLLALKRSGQDTYFSTGGSLYSVKELLKIIPKEQLPSPPFNNNSFQPQEDNKIMSYQPQTWEKLIVLLTGTVFIALIGFLLIRNEPFADRNLVVLARILLSVIAGLFSATIPGFLNIDFSVKGLAIRATGALAMGVLTYIMTPTVL
jgi:GTPase SAR1 family protein